MAKIKEPVKESKVEGPGGSDDIERTHPSFGMARVNHNTGRTRLFGSHVEHSGFVSLVISRGRHYRRTNSDDYWSDEELIEVWLSNVQLAEMLFAAGTQGVPCTIKRFNGDMIEEPKYEPSGRETFIEEFRQRCKEITDEMVKFQSLVTRMGKGKTIKKSDFQEMAKGLESILMQVRNNLPFILEQFTEQTESVAKEYKAEVELSIQRSIEAKGLKALLDQKDGPKMLDFGE